MMRLWKFYEEGSLRKLSFCYNKRIKICFGYKRRDSMMTQLLFDLGLPRFNTVIVNSSGVFLRCYYSCSDKII